MREASSPRPNDAEIEEKWRAYPDTVLEFAGSPPLRIDLRRPLGAADRAALAARALDQPFGVFTAENPAGENAEDEPSPSEAEQRERTNARRAGVLETELQRRRVAYVHVDGASPDGKYREHCVATLMPREEAVAFARRFEQLALFWYDGGHFWLLPAMATKSPQRLPARD